MDGHGHKLGSAALEQANTNKCTKRTDGGNRRTTSGPVGLATQTDTNTEHLIVSISAYTYPHPVLYIILAPG